MFDDWKNAIVRIQSHERSAIHLNAIKAMLDIQNSSKVDKKLVKQLNKEKYYWTQVLQRVISNVIFLSERGLAFRGNTDTFSNLYNGNYLGCLELLAEYDPFLSEHIKTHGNTGKRNVSYLSSTIGDEFIEILSKSLLTNIVTEI